MGGAEGSRREALARRVEGLMWYHSIDLGGGLVTPGECGPPNPDILRCFDSVDFRGKKVLDIGCWDGLWSFEAERRGAALVYATDKVDSRNFNQHPSFRVAHEALGSRVIYRPDVSVYDVAGLGVDDFDVVVFCGVFYHLKDPLLALARLRRVMKEGGTIIVEGEVLADEARSYAKFYYHDWLQNDPTNWWVPSARCLREWVECSYFEVLRLDVPEGQRTDRILTRDGGEQAPDERHERCYLTARAVRRRDPGYQGRDGELGGVDLAYDGSPAGAGCTRPPGRPHLWSRFLRRLEARRTIGRG